jgi:hypothetical protein
MLNPQIVVVLDSMGYRAAWWSMDRKSGKLIASRRNPYANERKAESYTMSCRIDRLVSAGDLVVLRVSGRIRAENLDTLRELLGREKAGVVIDLKEVTLVDRDAVTFLALSESGGIELRNCPAYVREWIHRERA